MESFAVSDSQFRAPDDDGEGDGEEAKALSFLPSLLRSLGFKVLPVLSGWKVRILPPPPPTQANDLCLRFAFLVSRFLSFSLSARLGPTPNWNCDSKIQLNSADEQSKSAKSMASPAQWGLRDHHGEFERRADESIAS